MYFSNTSWSNIAFGVMICQSIFLDGFKVFIALYCTEMEVKAFAELKPQEITARMKRELAARHSLTFMLKIWLLVNIESYAAYDMTTIAFIIQAIHDIMEATYWKTTDINEDVGEICLFNVVPVVMMIAYRGSFAPGDLDWAVKLSGIICAPTGIAGVLLAHWIPRQLRRKPVSLTSAGTQTGEAVDSKLLAEKESGEQPVDQGRISMITEGATSTGADTATDVGR